MTNAKAVAGRWPFPIGARLSWYMDDGQWQEASKQDAQHRVNVAKGGAVDLRHVGWVRLALRDLEQGRHTLRIKLHSNNNNHGAIDAIFLNNEGLVPVGKGNPAIEGEKHAEGFLAWSPGVDPLDGSSPIDLRQYDEFMIESQKRFYERMSREMRERIGMRQLIAPSNWKTADPQVLDGLERYTYTGADMVCRNSYFGVDWDVSNPSVLGQFPAAALMFRRGDVRQPDTPAVAEYVNLEQAYRMQGTQAVPLRGEDALWQAKLGDLESSAADDQAGIDPLAYFVGPVLQQFGNDRPRIRSVDLDQYIDIDQQTYGPAYLVSVVPD